MRTTRILVAVLITCASVRTARAEPALVSIEAQGALALTSPQSELFGPGGSLALNIRYPLLQQLLLGLEFRAGLLTDGDPPSAIGVVDPGLGTFELAMLMLRLRPMAAAGDAHYATGFFLDVGGGGGVTGELARIAFQGGLGYGFGLGDSAALAPTLRYLQLIQPRDALSGEDARLVMVGVEFSFFNARAATASSPPEAAGVPSDRDRDGVADLYDKCPDVAEDLDGHDDADGCPEPDNDGDGILDKDDACPDAAEDLDEFADEDGCPEPDNDNDQFLDADDQCPNEAEIVNGNNDYDGCPDEGLIVFEKDRIVLEERVLFDFERARIKREARPVLRAIVRLKQQHREWIQVRVEGHADALGEAAFNQELSERRANNVMEELIRLGIPSGQIRAVGYGSTRLRDKRSEEEANQRNRRVEFVVVSRGAPDPTQAMPPAAPVEASPATSEEPPDDDADESAPNPSSSALPGGTGPKAAARRAERKAAAAHRAELRAAASAGGDAGPKATARQTEPKAAPANPAQRPAGSGLSPQAADPPAAPPKSKPAGSGGGGAAPSKARASEKEHPP